MKPKKWSVVLLALAMIFTLIPTGAYADDEPIATPVEPNYGFIPNSGEASVSKVDLVNKIEIARYYTEPRVNAAADYNWRTSRIAMDAEGNAWVLNTGADGVNLQGSVVRIQADTSSLTTTHTYPNPVLPFGDDEAVKLFNVGGLGDMPRAIAIDNDGFIWIGFYSSGALMKFSFDGTDLILEESIATNPKLNFYEMKFAPAPDGKLYISSRNSTPSRTGDYGVWSFNPGTGLFYEEWNVDSPYSLLIDPVSGQVYATSYNNKLWIKGEVDPALIDGATQLRGMAFDGLGKIWIADTINHNSGNKVFWYDIDAGTSGYITLPIGTTPVGVGRDAAGLMWAVCRTDGVTAGGYIVAFDPADGSPEGSIRVGYRPYAYGDFVVPLPRYCIEGTKLEDFWTGVKTRETLEGWHIYLYSEKLGLADVPGDLNDPRLIAYDITDENGDYSFCGLLAGTYYIYEMGSDCYGPFEPANGMRTVTLPAEGNDGNAIDQDFINRRGKIQGIKYKDALGGTVLEGWEILLYKGDPAVGEPNKTDAFAWTTTDSLGYYMFDKLCPDTYYVYELLKDGWVQKYPSGGFWEVELAAGIRATGKHFVNEEEKFYDLCGHKFGVNWLRDETPLEGWKITLLDSDREFVAETTTDEFGKYCFGNLRAGDYIIVESYGDKNVDGFWIFDGKFWKSVLTDEIEVTLPDDATIDCVEGPFADFFNNCYSDETAWMFGDITHSSLGIPSENWGWSQSLGIVSGDARTLITLPIYAGAAQNNTSKGYLIGYIDIYWDGSAVGVSESVDPDVAALNMKVWIGNAALPSFKGVMTNAPGKLIVDPTKIDYNKELFVAVHFDTYVPCMFPHPELLPVE